MHLNHANPSNIYRLGYLTLGTPARHRSITVGLALLLSETRCFICSFAGRIMADVASFKKNFYAVSSAPRLMVRPITSLFSALPACANFPQKRSIKS